MEAGGEFCTKIGYSKCSKMKQQKFCSTTRRQTRKKLEQSRPMNIRVVKEAYKIHKKLMVAPKDAPPITTELQGVLGEHMILLSFTECS